MSFFAFSENLGLGERLGPKFNTVFTSSSTRLSSMMVHPDGGVERSIMKDVDVEGLSWVSFC